MSKLLGYDLKADNTGARLGLKPGSVFLAVYLCTLTLLVVMLLSSEVWHWFLLPLWVCGVLVGTDAIDWLRGRVGLFDPVGILGVMGFYFFLVAPLLHVYLDYWMLYVVGPPDWRDWLGGMAVLNAAGLLAYRVTRGFLLRRTRRTLSDKSSWTLDETRYPKLLAVGLLATAALQMWVYRSYGGLTGYIQAFSENIGAGGSFQNMGWIFMVSESFPILALFAFAFWARKTRYGSSTLALILALLSFFVLQMLFGGLRGSRSNTIWALFWAVGVLHLVVRPISKKLISVGFIFLVVFMYFYGFYKGAGLDALEALQSADARADLSQETGRDVNTLLLADLERSDVQAMLLYRLSSEDGIELYGWGRTYVGDAAILIPRALMPNRPPQKVKEGTEVLYGKGSYAPGVLEASRVYGLAGEAMLNFGPLAVPLAYALFGLLVGSIGRFIQRLAPTDSRLLLAPFLVNLCITVLVGDSDNIIFFLIKSGCLPFLVLWLGSRRIVSNQAQGRTSSSVMERSLYSGS